MKAVPSRPFSSADEPPRKPTTAEISGLLWSSTSQAVMPPGLTTFWMSMAWAGAAMASSRTVRTDPTHVVIPAKAGIHLWAARRRDGSRLSPG